MSNLVHSSCTAGTGHEELEAAGLQLSDHLPQEVSEGPTGPHHLLPHHLDIEGVGWVTTSGQLHSELSAGNAEQLLCCLAEMGLPHCLSWAWEKGRVDANQVHVGRETNDACLKRAEWQDVMKYTKQRFSYIQNYILIYSGDIR